MSQSAHETNAPAIRIEQLVVRYGRFTAVDDLTLDVPRGCLFGFLGPNGAGKTTTIKVLTGQLRPSHGTVCVLGLDVERELSALKPRFGYVPDLDNHFDEFTGQQNLELFCRFYNLPFERITEYLELVELVEERHIAVRNYSKGMKKKLLLARELLHKPDVIYLDEPTANLDVRSTQLVRGLLRRLAAEGRTIFLTTHNMKEVEEICDRVAILNQGRLVEVDSPTRLKTRNAERRLDVLYDEDGQSRRRAIDLDDPAQRAELAELLKAGRVVSLHSREFDFNEVFLKLTGRRSL
ncbi:MAG: ABC transporter ATP-binding protein [Phycisphaerae bacterium]|nr:ABC transporter ATP-binding protein [Phycisphaerae bacterium]NUQ45490.1 ABC transporter ATP-binding protein [Phycisphaerae bacterium]